MSRLLNSALNSDPATAEYKAAWQFLTDSRVAYDLIRERMEETDKATRIEARRQARAEYAERIALDTDRHEGEVVRDNIAAYWLRVAELCSILLTAEEIASMDRIRIANFGEGH